MPFFEEIEIGHRREIGTYTFTAESIKAFARQFDPQPFHLDPRAAAHPFFKGLVAHHGGDRQAAIAAMAGAATPLGRFATADETAAQIGFLLSDASATITGAVLVTDGGYSI